MIDGHLPNTSRKTSLGGEIEVKVTGCRIIEKTTVIPANRAERTCLLNGRYKSQSLLIELPKPGLINRVDKR